MNYERNSLERRLQRVYNLAEGFSSGKKFKDKAATLRKVLNLHVEQLSSEERKRLFLKNFGEYDGIADSFRNILSEDEIIEFTSKYSGAFLTFKNEEGKNAIFDGDFAGLGIKTIGFSLENSIVKKNSLWYSKIGGHAMRHSKIKDNAMKHSKINGNAMRYSQIKDNAMKYSQIKGASIYDSTISENAMEFAKISGHAMRYPKIKDNAMKHSKINGNALRYSEVSGDALWYSEISKNAMSQSTISENSMRYSKAKDNAINHSTIEGNSLWNSEIKDLATSFSKISDFAIGFSKIPKENILNWDISSWFRNLNENEKPAGKLLQFPN